MTTREERKGSPAADAHDLAHGVHRLTIDDATVERAAEALKGARILPTWMPDNALKDMARAVLAAAVQEER